MEEVNDSQSFVQFRKINSFSMKVSSLTSLCAATYLAILILGDSHHICFRLVSLHFLCDILSGVSGGPVHVTFRLEQQSRLRPM